MHITKGQGAVLTLLPMSLYVVPYYQLVSESKYMLPLLGIFTLGVLFLFLVKIEAGTEGELLWFEKLVFDKHGDTVVWSDGLCLVPTLFPFLHKVKVHLFWWIKKPITEQDYFDNNNASFIHHYVDQRDMRFNVNVDTSLLAANATRVSGNIFTWFFNINRGAPELLFQRFGTRIIIVALLLGFIANVIGPTRQESKSSWFENTVSSVKQNIEEAKALASPTQATRRTETSSVQETRSSTMSSDPGVDVLVQLQKQAKPTIPEKDFFKVIQGDILYYTLDSTGRKYYYYTEVPEGMVAMITVKESMCAAIPAGKEMRFVTNRPPTYAVNMKSKLIYLRKPEHISLLQAAGSFIFDGIQVSKEPLHLYATWGKAYNEWEAFDTSYGILVQAITLDEIPKGGEGGMVCF